MVEIQIYPYKKNPRAFHTYLGAAKIKSIYFQGTENPKLNLLDITFTVSNDSEYPAEFMIRLETPMSEILDLIEKLNYATQNPKPHPWMEDPYEEAVLGVTSYENKELLSLYLSGEKPDRIEQSLPDDLIKSLQKLGCLLSRSLEFMPIKEYENIFKILSTIGDNDFSLAVLHILLKAYLSFYDEEDFKKFSTLFPEENSYTHMLYYDENDLEYCWNLATDLANIVTLYSKYNRGSNTIKWCDLIPNQEFVSLIDFLISVTYGGVELLFQRDLLSYFEMENYIDDFLYDPYDILKKYFEYVGRFIEWIAEYCPTPPIKSELYHWCADYLKYSFVSTPQCTIYNDYLGSISKILLWNPSVSLGCLCKAYTEWPSTENECFDPDLFYQELDEISSKLPGNLINQLLGLFYTHTDIQIKRGAVALLVEKRELSPSSLVELVKAISEIEDSNERSMYLWFLPHEINFDGDTKSNRILTEEYRQYLEKINS